MHWIDRLDEAPPDAAEPVIWCARLDSAELECVRRAETPKRGFATITLPPPSFSMVLQAQPGALGSLD